MTSEISCPQCNNRMRLTANDSDTRIRCVRCGVWLDVPSVDDAPSPVDARNHSSAVDAGRPEADLGAFDEDDVVVDFSSGTSAHAMAGRATEATDAAATHVEQAHHIGQIPVDEPIDFASLDVANTHEPHYAALSLSSMQLRDAVRYAEATRTAVRVFYWIMAVSLLLQLIGMAIIVFSILRGPSAAPAGNASGFVAVLISGFVSVVMTGMLRLYALHLGEFVRTKSPSDLVESLAASSRLWQVAAVLTGIAIVVGVFIPLLSAASQ